MLRAAVALELAGTQPTRASFAKYLMGVSFDLGGATASCAPGDQTGATFVDFARVMRQGKLLQ